MDQCAEGALPQPAHEEAEQEEQLLPLPALVPWAAKVENCLSAPVAPHSGHGGALSAARCTSASKTCSHFLHPYSYSGMR